MSIHTDAVPEASAPADALRLRINKLDLLERLSDDLAHEIKNPLHSMVINLEVLKRRAARVAADGAEDLQRYAEVLGAELERVNRRIELLLRLCRPGRGAEQASPGELVEELMELLQLEARHHQVTLSYEPGERPVRVRLPRESGRQVVLNLVLDALERGGRGGRLRLRLVQEEAAARLEVATEGGEAAEPDGPGGRAAVIRALAEDMGARLEDHGPVRRSLVLPAVRP